MDTWYDLWHVLWPVQVAFTIWMLIDSHQRGAEPFWFWVILFFQPVGSWAYFGLVWLRLGRLRFRAHQIGDGRAWWKPRPSVAELRYRAERAPTVVNRMTLADRLIETKAYAEAAPHLEAVLAVEPEYCQALYSLARCYLEEKAPDRAAELLDRLIAKDRRWSNYAAWRLLILARAARGDAAGALAATRDLARLMPTFECKCLLAEHLIANRLHDEAARSMEQALEDYRFAPFAQRWRDRSWARRAHQLLQEAKAPPTASA